MKKPWSPGGKRPGPLTTKWRGVGAGGATRLGINRGGGQPFRGGTEIFRSMVDRPARDGGVGNASRAMTLNL
jgi:hypothetical protein